jgi:hypothetical protein
MLPPEYSEYYEYEESSFTGGWMRTRQLWVQTSNESLVCILGNASYDVDFEFVNGVQTTARSVTTDFEPLWLPAFGTNDLGEYWFPQNNSKGSPPKQFTHTVKPGYTGVGYTGLHTFPPLYRRTQRS